MAFVPLSNTRRTPVEKVETVSAITLLAFCAELVGARCAPTFTCSDLLLGRRGLLFFGDLVILENFLGELLVEIVGWLPLPVSQAIAKQMSRSWAGYHS